MIKQTIFSVATDESKPILTGELFKFDENCFNAVAIDGFRVSWRKTVCEYDGYTEMVVPSKTLNELARLYLMMKTKKLLFTILLATFFLKLRVVLLFQDF